MLRRCPAGEARQYCTACNHRPLRNQPAWCRMAVHRIDSVSTRRTMHGRRGGAAAYVQREFRAACVRERERDHGRDEQRRGGQRA
eukprot:2446873-Pleurochrysis_carterae.AAC.1